MLDLQAFADNVWIADGPNVRDFGVMFTTRMTVVKLSDGSLWVDSPVSVPSDALEPITKLGSVRYLVAATPRHVWRLAAWHTLFPEAQLWAPRTTPFTLKKRAFADPAAFWGTRHIKTGETTLTNLPSKAIRSSKKSSFFIDNRARSFWTI